MEAGKIYNFKVLRKTDIGYILKHNDEEVFMHDNDCDDKVIHVDEDVEAFVFYDSKKRMAATLQIPLITVDDYDFCEVVGLVKMGVFVSIGTRKDVLVSHEKLPDDKKLWPIIGDKLLVTIKERNNSLVAIPATRPVLKSFSIEADNNLKLQDFEGTVVKVNYAGVNILTVEGYFGFIHESNMRKVPRLGQKIQGKIIEVLHNGEISCNIIPQKETIIGEDSVRILEYLEKHGGIMHLTDKSNPDDIKKIFNISKSAFKRAIGNLLKANMIIQDIDNNEIKKID